MDAYLIESEIMALEQEPTDFDTCGKLAMLYIVRDHLGAEPLDVGGSEFLNACGGKDPEAVLIIIDELMEVQKVLHPEAYSEVMARIQEI